MQELNMEEMRLQRTLRRIRHKVVVMSGKGGVGKSTFAVNLAAGLALAGKRVGLIDVDVHGPSVPRLLGLHNARVTIEKDYIEPVRWSGNLSVMSLGFLLPDMEQAVVWRGPVKMGFIRQLLSDVVWGDLDYLIADCPPGTGDEPLSVMQLLGPEAKGLIVTTPQAVAIDDVRRSISFCRDLGNPVLGLVENMSGIACSQCGHLEELFGKGGGEDLAQEMEIPFLGAVPLDPQVVRSGDKGLVFVQAKPDSAAANVVMNVVREVLALSDNDSTDTPEVTGSVKVAVTMAGGELCRHAGYCEHVLLAEADVSQGTISNQQTVPAPEDSTTLPAWLTEHGVNVLITGGLAAGMDKQLQSAGITCVTGIPDCPPEEAVQDWLKGKLTA
ncbi:iron-sulfur cluster carrier protein MrpORP [Oleidesulfovibrio sp.]|uniref:iron-sulfur cluster carrier protein MrpORP n=1 Tax=Oleidesulfovibrio sp. TaxID=2909707 RepID=UPI003A835266